MTLNDYRVYITFFFVSMLLLSPIWINDYVACEMSDTHVPVPRAPRRMCKTPICNITVDLLFIFSRRTKRIHAKSDRYIQQLHGFFRCLLYSFVEKKTKRKDCLGKKQTFLDEIEQQAVSSWMRYTWFLKVNFK